MKVSTTDQVQDWLTENTFECAALGARMDLEQCLSNRMKAQGLQFPGLLTACIRCERAGGGQRRVGAFGRYRRRGADRHQRYGLAQGS